MAEENGVQLKQEEIVGNEVVLSDINPITNTKSVKDLSSGTSLEKTMARMWQSINGKLSRIVNSVNGRTGVVVLNSDDVGLGNVDNISFADIKKWVINKLEIEFGNKRIYLAESLDEIDQLIATNDMKHRDRPFYSKHGYGTDKRSYIGYIAYDELTETLKHEHMVMRTIGDPDNSIIYDEKVGDTPEKDMTGGGIGVNIYKYEDALYLYNDMTGGGKEESGLRIDKTKIAGRLYYFDGLYGSPEINSYNYDPGALLSRRGSYGSCPTVHIYIDDVEIISDDEFYMIYGYDNGELSPDEEVVKIKTGDLIYTNFKYYDNNRGHDTSSSPEFPEGMDATLMGRAPAIGMVISEPHLDIYGNMIDEYVIKFVSIKPNVGWGLQNISNHAGSDTVTSDYPDTELTLRLATGNALDGLQDISSNMSGLQVIAKPTDDPSLIDNENYASLISDTEAPLRYSVTPTGAQPVFRSKSSDGGLYISPDMSLCLQPQQVYGKNSEVGHSDAIANWNTISPIDYKDNASIEKGSLLDQSLIGLNLSKLVIDKDNSRYYANCSGLRLINSTFGSPDDDTINSRKLSNSFFGCMDYELNYSSDFDINNLDHSGGLSVNVGDFLEIGPPRLTTQSMIPKEEITARLDADLEKIAKFTYYINIYCYYRLDGSYPTNVSDSDKAKCTLTYTKVCMDQALEIMRTDAALLRKYVTVIHQSQTESLNAVDKYIQTYETFVSASGDSAVSSGPLTWEDIASVRDLFPDTVQSLYATIFDYYDDNGTFFQKSSDEYFDSGKVNVRIGSGLTNVENRITLNIKPNGGLTMDDSGQLYIENYHQNLTPLQLTFSGYGGGGNYIYDPSEVSNPITNSLLKISIGKGLTLEYSI